MRPKFDMAVNSVNDRILFLKGGELSYNIVLFKGMETRFDLIFYNSRFDASLKSYSILKLQSHLKTSFSYIQQIVVTLLFYYLKNIS